MGNNSDGSEAAAMGNNSDGKEAAAMGNNSGGSEAAAMGREGGKGDGKGAAAMGREGGKGRKWIAVGCAAVAMAAAGSAFYISAARDVLPTIPVMSFTELAKEDIVDSLGAKGTVESVEKRGVYSTLGYTVKQVRVEAGDRVKAGQELALLDTENLELDIAARKADLDLYQRGAAVQLENSERALRDTSGNLESGKNSLVLSAESALRAADVSLENAQRSYDDALRDSDTGGDAQVRSARQALSTAQKNYDDALFDLDNDLDARVASAKSALTAAKLDLESKQSAYDNASALYEAGAASTDDLRRAEDALEAARIKADDASTSLDNANTSQTRALEQAERALQSARTSYDNAAAQQKRALEQAEGALSAARTAQSNAQAAVDAARVNAAQDAERQKGAVDSARISTETESQLIAIRKLEKQLEDSSIKSPIDGTVTAVYAKEGAAGSGLLFVVEDTEKLKVAAWISEFDVGRVRPGMAATVESDATGGAAYRGEVSKVDPASAKNASGDTAAAASAASGAAASGAAASGAAASAASSGATAGSVFGAEVLVTERSDLRIGMAARLTIEIEKEVGAYKVAYGAILLGKGGSGAVFVAEEAEPGQFVARRMEVEVGLMTDYYVEIRGAGLADGMKILDDASVAADGMAVLLRSWPDPL